MFAILHDLIMYLTLNRSLEKFFYGFVERVVISIECHSDIFLGTFIYLMYYLNNVYGADLALITKFDWHSVI